MQTAIDENGAASPGIAALFERLVVHQRWPMQAVTMNGISAPSRVFASALTRARNQVSKATTDALGLPQHANLGDCAVHLRAKHFPAETLTQGDAEALLDCLLRREAQYDPDRDEILVLLEKSKEFKHD